MSEDTERYLRIVEKLADKLCRDALWFENQCNWLGIFHHTQIANAKILLRALPSNFYEGSVGVGFFLAAAFRQFQKPVYKQTAIGALKKSVGQIHNIRDERIGFYEGKIGIAYAAIQAGEWLMEEELIAKGKEIIENIIENKNLSWRLDMQEGCTGAIPTLISLNKKYSFLGIDGFLNSLGEYILEKAKKTKKGWSWKTVDGNFEDLTGYAHGTAGIAHALIELFAFSKNEKYFEAAEEAIRYENHFFSEKYMNWKDNRITTPKRTSSTHFALSAWCVGSVGIGFSRIRTFQLTENKKYLIDIERALKRCEASMPEFSKSFSLCHGFFGEMSFLLTASQILNEPSYEKLVTDKTNSILENYQDFKKPLPDGREFSLENPSFMLGWAGIGYFLLRLATKEFPEILMIT